MAIVFEDINNTVQTAGTTTTAGTCAITPTLPSALTDGVDRAWVVAAHTHAYGSTPAGWTALFKDVALASSLGAAAAGAGQRFASAFYRDKDASWSTMPSFALASTTNGSHALQSMSISKTSAAHTWNTPTYTSTPGADTTAGTAYSATTGSLTLHTGGVLISVTGINDGFNASSGSTPTQTGSTIGAGNIISGSTVTGHDVGLIVVTAPVTTGGGTGAITQAMTLSSASQGGTIVIEQTETLVAGANINTLVEDFDDASDFLPNGNISDSPLWDAATNFIRFGKAAASFAGSAFTLASESNYDITGSSIKFQVREVYRDAGAATSALVGCYDVGAALGPLSTGGFYFANNGTGGATTVSAGTATGGAVGTSRTHVDGDWYRLTEASGNVTLAYSSDGTSWTTLNTVTVASLGWTTKTNLVFAAYAATGLILDNINTSTTIAAMTTLVDTFSTGSAPNTAIWDVDVSGGTGTAVLTSQKAVLTGGSGSVGMAGDNPLNLQNSNLTAQISSVTGGSGALQIIPIGQIGLGGGSVGWEFDSTTAYVIDPSGTQTGSRTRTNGEWYRVREAGGIIYWEYSATGSTWTALASQATSTTLLGYSPKYCLAQFYAYPSGVLTVDNVGNPPPPPKIATISENFATGTFSGTGYPVTSGQWDRESIIPSIGAFGGLDYMSTGPWDWYESAMSFETLGAGLLWVQSFNDPTGVSLTIGGSGYEGPGAPGAVMTMGYNSGTYGVDWEQVVYNPVDHKCIRIRQNTDFTVGYDASPDGSTWTQLFVAPGPGLALIDTFTFSGLFTIAAIDNINLAPTSPIPPVGTVVEVVSTFPEIFSAYDGSTSPDTLGLNLGAGANALVFFSACLLAGSLPTMTYGGVSVPQLATVSDATFKYGIHGLLNPAAGNQNLVVTSGASMQTYLEGYAFSGVASFGGTVATNDGGGSVTTKLGDLVLFGQAVADVTTSSLYSAHNTYTPLNMFSSILGGVVGLDWHTSSLVIPDLDLVTLAVNLVSASSNTRSFFFMQ